MRNRLSDTDNKWPDSELQRTPISSFVGVLIIKALSLLSFVSRFSFTPPFTQTAMTLNELIEALISLKSPNSKFCREAIPGDTKVCVFTEDGDFSHDIDIVFADEENVIVIQELYFEDFK